MRWITLFLVAWSFGVPAPAAETAHTTLSVRGMTCGGCVAAVKYRLQRTEGVTTYDVSLDRAEAKVAFDPAKTDPDRIAASVSKTGFVATVKVDPPPREKP